MKTKNNVQKTALRAAAILAIFFISAFSQSMGAENKSKNGNDAALMIQAATDEKMVIENWMTNENLFSSGSLPETAVESPMGIEAWMTNDKLFATANSALAPAAEPKMELDDWMLDENNFAPKQVTADNAGSYKKVEMWKVKDGNFGNRKFILTQVNDRKMEVEKWMLGNRYW